MKLKDLNVLFFTRTMRLGGTENVVLQMCEILKPYVNKIVVCSSGGINVEKLEVMGIKHYEIPDINDKKFTIIYHVFKIIPQIINKEKINFVHTHHRMATFYMYFLKKKCPVKLVSTLHGVFLDKKILTRIIYKNIDVIACGEMVKDSFIKNYGITAKHINVINNSIKKDNREIKKVDFLYELPEKYKKIGYIGRLSPEKGVDILVDAIPVVVKANPDFVFVIAGTGEQENSLKKRVMKEGLDKFVIFLGYRNDAQNIIKQMDAIVLPSYTEGLPLTPLEAFAQGKPVVATSAGGTVEIVEDNVNGMIVPIGDSNALAAAILKIFESQDKYEKMSIMALKSFEEKFSYNTFEDKIIKFYKNMCKDVM